LTGLKLIGKLMTRPVVDVMIAWTTPADVVATRNADASAAAVPTTVSGGYLLD